MVKVRSETAEILGTSSFLGVGWCGVVVWSRCRSWRVSFRSMVSSVRVWGISANIINIPVNSGGGGWGVVQG